MKNISVLLADDHPVVRAGLRQVLESEPDLTVVGECGDGSGALELTRQLIPDVLVLDMELPGTNGCDVARKLVDEATPTEILVLSAYDDEQYISAVLESGIAGYLIKDEAPQEIVTAIRGIARGERGWISKRVITKFLEIKRSLEDRRQLTDREIEIMQVLVGGKTNREIGDTLGISERTVEKHLEEIYARLGVFSRVGAAVTFLRTYTESEAVPKIEL